MAFTRGVKIKECHAEIIQKLNSNGECLQNSTKTLLLEMKVLNKLIYKSRNTHSKEKFFKCLERIKKCLDKWKFLDLDNKVITACRKISGTEFCIEILNKIMLGGKLSVRVIILCQETVQYSLAYLSRGFFVLLHVTFLSLLSRLWVLQKDCLNCVVACYQLVRSLFQLTDNNIDLNDFPESLTSWLGEDFQKIFDGKSVDDNFSVANSSNPIFQQLFSDKTDTDTLMMVSEDVSADDELDLGEPVKDVRMLYSPGCLTPTTSHNETVSGLKTNLTLKIDLESSGRKNVREIDLKHANNQHFRTNDNFETVKANGELEKSLKDETLKDAHRCQIVKIAQQKTQKSGAARKSDNGMIVRRVARSFHRRGNRFFIKKTQCRYTLRNLLTTKDFAVSCSTKNLRVLVKCLSFALRECGLSPDERKMLSRQQRLLKRELRNRNIFKERPKEDEISLLGTTGLKACGTFSKIYTQKENCQFLRNSGIRQKFDVHTDPVGIDKKSWARSKKMNICSLKNEKKCKNNPPVFKRHVSDYTACDDGFQKTRTVGSNSGRFPKEAQDEIDDIFSSLGL